MKKHWLGLQSIWLYIGKTAIVIPGKEVTKVMCLMAADVGSASEGSYTTKFSPKSQKTCLESRGKEK